MKKFAIVLSIIIFCLPFISLAHSGHGEHGGYTITHYFTEPVHVVASFSLLIAVVAGIRMLNKKRQQQNS